MQQMGRSVMRTVKGSVKGYSDTQTKVRNATSNDPWGPSGTEMSEIAALTFNSNDFVEIIETLDKRLNDKGKNWRHVFKSLTLLDYILHAGSENVVQYFRENIYVVKTLKEFQYIDEFGKDQGANVRQKAKDITNLLLDENKMKASRLNRKDMRDRMSGGERPRSNTDPHSRRQVPDRSGARSADQDLEAAIAASKRTAQEEASRDTRSNEDRELEEALRLSREEDERRRRELESSSGGNLFDEQQQQQQQQSNNLIDIDSAPSQQPMQTGYASYNPYAAQQQAMYEEQMRQAQLMELQRQQQEQMYMQQQMAQQQMAQQQMQEQYMRLQQQQYEAQMAYQAQMAQQQQQPILPQPTAFGTNNPFAAFAPTPSPAPQMPQQTGAPSPARAPSPPSAATNAPAPSQSPFRARPPKDDGKHADLARMLAAGREDGIDSFGNIGNLRVPVGQQFATKTGNPFLPQQTGQPQQQSLQSQPQQNNQQPFFTI
ncbi:hypothetical protein OIV83_000752 [Microbotryomycetes sp. JL201]|nr:hypothetical protein OIV83_000752 [Microbotryomycetes sp. JL201]